MWALQQATLAQRCRRGQSALGLREPMLQGVTWMSVDLIASVATKAPSECALHVVTWASAEIGSARSMAQSPEADGGSTVLARPPVAEAGPPRQVKLISPVCRRSGRGVGCPLVGGPVEWATVLSARDSSHVTAANG
jgi:hypothetical protein